MVDIQVLKAKAQTLNNVREGLNKQLEKLKLEKQTLKTKIEMNNEKVNNSIDKLYICLQAIGYDIEKENIIDSLDTIVDDIDFKLTAAIEQLNEYENILKAV